MPLEKLTRTKLNQRNCNCLWNRSVKRKKKRQQQIQPFSEWCNHCYSPPQQHSRQPIRASGELQYCAKRMQTNFAEFRLLFNRKIAEISGEISWSLSRNFVEFSVSCAKIRVLPENSLIQERNFEAISFVLKRNFLLLIENSKSWNETSQDLKGRGSLYFGSITGVVYKLVITCQPGAIQHDLIWKNKTTCLWERVLGKDIFATEDW